MEKVVSRVYEEIETLFEVRKTYEKQIKAIENTIKENNKEVKQINKELKSIDDDCEEASVLNAKKDDIASTQEKLQSEIPGVQNRFEQQYQKIMEKISKEWQEEACIVNDEVTILEKELIASHEEEKDSLLEVQNKIDGLQKLNRAEMPESFRERLRVQIKEQEKNKDTIQKSFEQKRETLQLKIEEAKSKVELAKDGEKQDAIKEIIQAIKEENWKQAEEMWKPFRKAKEEKIEEVPEKKETENSKELIQEEVLNVQKEKIEEVEQDKLEDGKTVEEDTKKVEENKEEQVENTMDFLKVNAIYIDMVSEKIYADIGENDSKDYNFEKEMKIHMLDKENKISILKRHVPNFARIVAEKEKGEASEKSEHDYERYLEIFEKVDPFVLAVLEENHEELRKYLKAIKNNNKEEMPFELFYNLKKITQTDFTQAEQDEIIEYAEANSKLASQVRGLKKAKRARKWRKFEDKHLALRAIMRWIRMEEKAKQLTEGK